MKIQKFCILIMLAGLLIAGCAGPTRTVSRVSAEEVTDISGNWNDTDSRLVAQQIIKELLYHPWIEDFAMYEGRKPIVIVGSVRNQTQEHIQTSTFIKDIEKELVNSGKVTFVASKKEREEIRGERLEQQSFASDETAKRLAAESGADFMLQGVLQSFIDSSGGVTAKFYQANLELINVENNEKVWMGDKKIKKIQQKSKAKW